MLGCDVYALCSVRSLEPLNGFLEIFLKGGTECTDEYESQQWSISQFSYSSVDDLIARLIKCPGEQYSIYWAIEDSVPTGVVSGGSAHFTRDGGLVLGLYVAERHIPTIMQQLADVLDSEFACSPGEQPPPDTVLEFKELCRRCAPPRLVEGVWTVQPSVG